MTRSLWFVVPVHGRLKLASVCLRQLRRTCDQLQADGLHATAVVVTDRRTHSDLRKLTGNLGFGAVSRENDFLGRKFNDGIQLATDPDHNPYPADYVVPFGSDDWADHRVFLTLPGPRSIIGFQRMSFVREDGREMVTAELNYTGGSGIRIIPRTLLEALNYRPCDEDRKRSCDTSMLSNLRVEHGDSLDVRHRHLHDAQIVDWKSSDLQLNAFDTVTRRRRSLDARDPFVALRGVYPDEALEEMAALYGVPLKAAA